MATTKRRGSKEFNEALKNATNVRVYSLEDGFRGEMLDDERGREVLAYTLRKFNWTMLRREDAVEAISTGLRRRFKCYSVRVHSNLWYTFEVPVAPKVDTLTSVRNGDYGRVLSEWGQEGFDEEMGQETFDIYAKVSRNGRVIVLRIDLDCVECQTSDGWRKVKPLR